MRPSRPHRNPSLATFLLLNELLRTASTHGIPPITLASIAAQILLFLRIIPLPWTSVWEVCLSYHNIADKREYLRLIVSQLEHADDWHLYYNMVSFLWKGRSLERRLGSVKFAITLIVFTLCTAFTYLALNLLLANVMEDSSYLRSCSVGFSGVIFALKVLTTHYDQRESSYLLGIPIGSKYAVWAELVLISLLTPNASFVGHLAGILVGLAYTTGPLEYVIDVFRVLISSNSDDSQSRGYRSAPNFRNYFPYGMSEDQQMRRATEESVFNSRPNNPTAPPYPTQDFNTFSEPSTFDSQTNFMDSETLRNLRLSHYNTQFNRRR